MNKDILSKPRQVHPVGRQATSERRTLAYLATLSATSVLWAGLGVLVPQSAKAPEISDSLAKQVIAAQKATPRVEVSAPSTPPVTLDVPPFRTTVAQAHLVNEWEQSGMDPMILDQMVTAMINLDTPEFLADQGFDRSALNAAIEGLAQVKNEEDARQFLDQFPQDAFCSHDGSRGTFSVSVCENQNAKPAGVTGGVYQSISGVNSENLQERVNTYQKHKGGQPVDQVSQRSKRRLVV